MRAVRPRSGGEDECQHDGWNIKTSILTPATAATRARAMHVWRGTEFDFQYAIGSSQRRRQARP